MDFAINQAPEAQAFLSRVSALPKEAGVSLDPVLKPFIDNEAELRRLFAQDRTNARLNNPYLGLVSVYEAPEDAGIRTARARAVKDEDLLANHIFPIPDFKRRKDFDPCVVDSLEDFQKNWAIFTEGSLSQLKDWNNVIAAGGSVLGCLLPLDSKNRESRRTIRKFYHSAAYPTSDVDLFLWGLTPEQAEVKINQIYEAVRDSVPWDVTCVRSKHAISIHSEYPYRSVQIVLRLYHSPAEILAGFDVDAPCVAYDGSRILANPRSIIALMRQANTVDVTRRSPSYEIRLAKYASRGFEVLIPNLRRSDIDPTIFERSLNRITGLARLLVLEKLAKPESRISYLESRRELRSRVKSNTIYTRHMRNKRKGDLKADEEIAGLDMNDYDVASLHIPYGPGWTAKRIEKLVFQTDLGMNSTFNPKNKDRRLHRHVAFFGTMRECVEDLCELCPEPKNDEEKALQEEEDKQYIRGRISFIEEDPGRQSMTGSFNPIDIGEWSELAYLGPTEKLFAAIVAKDRHTVQQLLTSEEVDVNRRDPVGRTTLQVGVLCGATEICMDLIDAGVRLTARIADGRTALHLAAQADMSVLVEKMLERSAQNAKIAEEEKVKATAENNTEIAVDKAVVDKDGDDSEMSERASSEDDWSSEEDEERKKSKPKTEENAENDQPSTDADIPEDNPESPDILDINLTDWDLAFTPLNYAIITGSKGVVQALLNAGADPKLVTKAKDYAAHLFHPLSLVPLLEDDSRAEEIIDQLLHVGANCAQADQRLFSVFHSLVLSGRARLVEKVLRSDPTASAALNVPVITQRGKAVYPLVSAIGNGSYALAALLLSYGAKVNISAEDFHKAKSMAPEQTSNFWYRLDYVPHKLDYLKDVSLPIETALAYQSYTVKLLIALGAQVSVPINEYFEFGIWKEDCRLSLVECLGLKIKQLQDTLNKVKDSPSAPALEFSEAPKTFAEVRKARKGRLDLLRKKKAEESNVYAQQMEDKLINEKDETSRLNRSIAYFEEMKKALEGAGAKTFTEIFEDPSTAPKPLSGRQKSSPPTESNASRTQYQLISERTWNMEFVPIHQMDQYDALFEACWTGDNSRIEDLCLPRKASKSTKSPIRIAVITKADSNGGTYTPLSVAILARKWDTARLVFAIATAQYKPKEEKASKRLAAQSFSINIDPDSDDDDDTVRDSDDDSMEVDETEEISITDLAARDSAIQCDVSPKLLLDINISGGDLRNAYGYGNTQDNPIIHLTCCEGDLEAFVFICDLMQQLPKPQEITMECMLSAFIGDSPEIVEEIIRRAGLGIDLSQAVASENDTLPVESNSKLYLGLTVHGKKRKDLARFIEGSHPESNSNHLPLLWTAIQFNAKKVIAYISGSGPLVAFRYYAATKTSERAMGLRKIQDLDKQLPKLLGIEPNSRRETALTAAIVAADKKERAYLAKMVLALFPSQKYLQSSIAFTGWTPLHLAAAENLEPAFFDFLFANGLEAERTDKRGLNIYHIVCLSGHLDLLKYLLAKLPDTVTSHLLTQTIRKSGETPIMLAVHGAKLHIVDALLQLKLHAVKESLTIRDAKGSMPLHASVRHGYAKITSSIIKAFPTSEAVYSENGVGETPLETAFAKWLIRATRKGFPNEYGFNGLQEMNVISGSLPNAQKLTTEIDLLRDVQSALAQKGKLSANTKLKDELDVFATYLTEKRDAEFIGAIPPRPEKPLVNDYEDREETLKVVSAAALSLPGQRRLVHLVDVQRSVQNSLEQANRTEVSDIGDEYYQRRRFKKSTEIPDEADSKALEKREQWNGVLGRSSILRNLTDFQ